KEIPLLPDDIDGSKKYKIKATVCNYTELVKDRRWFKLSSSTVSDPDTIRRVEKCSGSFVCQNPHCSYLSTEGKRNTSKFFFSSGLRVCHSCGQCVSSIPCYARKLIEFRETEGYVYVAHIGTHTCTLKVKRNRYDSMIRKEIEQNKTLPPKKLKLKLIKDQVGKGKMEEAKDIAKIFSDGRRVKSIRRQILESDNGPAPNSMEAIGGLKETSDNHDPMHIYKINSSSMNPDFPDFVFKSSQMMMDIALQMDQAGPENVLQDELCFFDGAHSRVLHFVALGAWVLHPSMRLLLRLASMEVPSESSASVKLFWDLFNECLQKVRATALKTSVIDKSYKFNPKGFMCDESGANFKGIEAAFDKETVIHKVKTCQWHFKHQARQKAVLAEEFEEEVLELCSDMCEVSTVVQYEAKLNRLLEIAEKKHALLPFIQWWDARRYHVFKVFRHFNLPGVNCAEIGNAAWKREGKISLLEAANDDIATMLVQEREYLNFKEHDTPSPVASGPTDKKRAAKSHKVQLAAAKEIASVLSLQGSADTTVNELTNPTHFIPKPSASHKCKSRMGKGIPKLKRKGKLNPFPASISEKVNLARNILGKTPVESVTYEKMGKSTQPRITRPLPGTLFNPNYPYITFLNGLGIRKCQGCPAPIQHLPAPLDFVFRFKCIRPFLNKRENIWQDAINNGYCHLDLTCLLAHNKTFKIEDIRMESKTFLECTEDHLKYLHSIGLLEHITANMNDK
ncbi:MAG: hypothetical protein MJE68_14445, partial [Proteobacteria bacterium]|nr:hypothetical protein [Pseudomonadota bacterium]